MISFGMMMRADDLNLRYHNHCTSVQYWNQKGGARSPWPKLMPIHFLCLSGSWQLWIQFRSCMMTVKVSNGKNKEVKIG